MSVTHVLNLKISLEKYLMGCVLTQVSSVGRTRIIVAACKSDEIHFKMKKAEITKAALEHLYERPHLREERQLTPRQTRLKMILHEALDIAHTICEHGSSGECLWAWEMVDEIDDAAARAGVIYTPTELFSLDRYTP